MKSRVVLFAICAAATLLAADDPKFEAASVKRADQCAFENSIDPGRLSLKGDPLKAVLSEAFHVKMDQITGPAWLDGDCFDITAKMPDGATRDQLPAMLEALLVERFKLTAHKESHPSRGYALVVDKGGLKVKESDPNSNFLPGHRSDGLMIRRPSTGSAGFKGSMTMESLAGTLSRQGYGPVQDSTGLKGKYDIDLIWAPDPAFESHESVAPLAGEPPPPTADLFAAVQALGLRLEPRKTTVEVLVIDHIERVPTGN